MTDNYSILMSVYKKEKPEYFKEAIDSMLNQTVKTDDFVIVCDGPLSEGLDNVIADYVTTYSGLFNVYRLPHNMGLAKALNHGILQCKNEIIARMDSDDISVPERIEKQLKAMKDRHADIVGANIKEFTGQPSDAQKERTVPENNEEIIAFAKKRSPFNHPSVLYKKSAVVNVGFYEDYRYFEDYNLWVTMLLKGYQGYNVQESLVFMRGGEDMYKRRGGLEYVKCIFRFQNHLRSMGFISMGTFLVRSFVRMAVSLVPNRFRTFLYKKVLRKDS